MKLGKATSILNWCLGKWENTFYQRGFSKDLLHFFKLCKQRHFCCCCCCLWVRFSWFAFSRMRTVWEERDSIFRGSRSQPHLPFHIKQTVLSSRAKSGQLCLMPAKKYSDCPSSGLFNELKPTVCTASFWYHPLQDLLAKELPLSVMFMVLI